MHNASDHMRTGLNDGGTFLQVRNGTISCRTHTLAFALDVIPTYQGNNENAEDGLLMS